jgi:uncharacterized protein YdcH (DUF465 family)
MAAKANVNVMKPHDLHHEFPQYAERIHHLKVSDGHFRRLFDEYHEVQKEIHRVERSGAACA